MLRHRAGFTLMALETFAPWFWMGSERLWGPLVWEEYYESSSISVAAVAWVHPC